MINVHLSEEEIQQIINQIQELATANNVELEGDWQGRISFALSEGIRRQLVDGDLLKSIFDTKTLWNITDKVPF